MGKHPASMRLPSVICIQLPQMIIAVSKAHWVAMQPPACLSLTEAASGGHQPVRGRLEMVKQSFLVMMNHAERLH